MLFAVRKVLPLLNNNAPIILASIIAFLCSFLGLDTAAALKTTLLSYA
ncbi:MAG TPA: hypothetical protein VMA37_18400 [Acetobacteraceae bacterium]|nr:hypothetical protein [Acetobacteraceae bacterium]